jgi:hypothetical protein
MLLLIPHESTRALTLLFTIIMLMAKTQESDAFTPLWEEVTQLSRLSSFNVNVDSNVGEKVSSTATYNIWLI